MADTTRLSLRFKLIWGLAAFGAALISASFGALLPIFYQDYLGLSARWIGLASMIYAAWNALNDPLFGYLTDRTRSRWGRRIPFMRFTAPFLAFTFVLVWLAPQGLGEPRLFGWMLVTMLLYDTCYTIIGLSYAALLPEVAEADANRHSLQVFASLMGLTGTLLGFLIPDLVRPGAGMAQGFGLFQGAMLAVGLVSAGAVIATTLGVRERPEFYQGDAPLPLAAMLRYTFTSRAFLILVAGNFMVILMNSLLFGVLFYLADYVLRTSAFIPLLALFVPLVIGVPLTQRVRQRLGVVGAAQALMALAGLALIAVTFVPTPLILPCLFLAGFGLAGPYALTNVLFAEVADEDELRSGVRREGAFFGVNALLTKPAQSIALALPPFVLEHTHFITRGANAGQIALNQPVEALWGIRALIGLIPGVALLLAAVILLAFPLRGRHLTEVQADIAALHELKRARWRGK